MCTETIICPLGKAIKRAFLECYADDRGAAEEHILGVMIAVHFGWNGLDILKTASAALEDANFHDECELVEQMIKNIKRFTH